MEKRLVFHLSEEAQKMVVSICKQILGQMDTSIKGTLVPSPDLERALTDQNKEIKRLKEEAVKLTKERDEMRERNYNQRQMLEENERMIHDLKATVQETEGKWEEAVKKGLDYKHKFEEADARLVDATQKIGQAYLDGKRDAKALDTHAES